MLCSLARPGPELSACSEIVRSWETSERLASQARDAMHERLFGEQLSESRRPIANSVTPSRAPYTGIWSPFDYWEPTYACVDDLRIPIGLVGDGAKWLCGPRAHRQGCKALSLGSNFDDSFERAIYDLAGCSSYIVDPTLVPRDRDGRLRSFVERIGQHGSVLNATVGVGASSGIRVRLAGKETRYATLVSLRELLLSKYGAHVHLDVAKVGFAARNLPRTLRCVSLHSSAASHALVQVDVEGGEFSVISEMGAMCAEGVLTVDQLNVEVHRAPRRHRTKMSEFTALFDGTRLCGLMIHHKERNNWARGENEVVEYAWVSPLHAARTMLQAMRSISGSAGPGHINRNRSMDGAFSYGIR